MRLLATFVLLLLLCSPVAAADWPPWDAMPAQEGQSSVAPRERGRLQQLVRFFQNYISPVDGPRCPMRPTCSSYSLQALDRHGPLLGVFFTVDRFYREIDPLEQQQPIFSGGLVHFYDPLDNNDFWLNPAR